jgi:hypothetical protein
VISTKTICAGFLLASSAFGQSVSGSRVIMRSPIDSLPYAAVPPDPNEPVTSTAQPVTAAERSNALALLGRAREPQRLLMRTTPPYQVAADFSSTSGAGNLTQLWMNGQKWRWSGNVGNDAAVRIGIDGTHFGSPNGGAIPPVVHVLRNAIWWAADAVPSPGAQMRTASVVWNGKPATCLLFSGLSNVQAESGPRRWDEEEYCVDDASGVLEVHSLVPGTYVDYGYSAAPFHGRSLPSQITIYAGGKKTIDAQLTFTDAGTPDDTVFTPTEQMKTWGAVGLGQTPSRSTMFEVSGSVSGQIKPVIVHASIDGQGSVVAEELSIASDPALAAAALDLVKNKPFPANGNTRELYIEVRFVPAEQ